MSAEDTAAEAATETDTAATAAAENTDLEASFDELLAEETAAIREARAAAGDADGTADDAPPAEGQEAKGEDDGGEPREEPKAAAKVPPKEERLVRRLQRSEAEVQQLRQELRSVREQAQQQPGFRPSGDLLGDVVQLAAMELGTRDPNDPRIRQRLQRLGQEVVAELAGDVNDPEIRAVRERRAQARQHNEVQRQIDDLKRQNAELSRQKEDREAVASVSAGLAELGGADEFPYLHAAEDDVGAAIYAGIRVLTEGGYRITDRQSAVDAIGYVARMLDEDHRRTAERLERAKAGKKSAAQPNQPQQQTRGARTDGPAKGDRGEDSGRGKTVTASGKGDRRPPAPKQETTDDVFESLLQEERAERRRAAQQRRPR